MKMLLACLATAIAGGAADPGDPAVVALVDQGSPFCTGVLVAPRVVLTAAHCGEHGIPPFVSFGADPRAGGATQIAAIDFHVHPDHDGSAAAHDLALVLLETASTVPPAALALDAGPSVGSELRIVGFGEPSEVKTASMAVVSDVAPASFVVHPAPGLPCPGDSGGPAFLGGAVVGIVSRGDPACTSQATYARIDGEVTDFIAPYLAATRDGSRSVGERCYYEGNCAQGTCYAPADAPDIRYCSPSCSSDAGCPSGLSCVDGACRYAGASPGAIGTACASALDCEEADCAELPAGRACSHPCFTADPGSCPAGFACHPTEDAERGECAADGASGCAVGGKSGGLWLLPVLAAALLLGRRSRRLW